MIQEDYVTFEQAKDLKELGFPQWNGSIHWPYYEGYSFNGKETSVISSNCKMEYSKVPLSLVQKWLREEKNLDMDINSHSGLTYKYYTIYLPIMKDCILDINDNPIQFETYEQALSKGINECIELLNDKLNN